MKYVLTTQINPLSFVPLVCQARQFFLRSVVADTGLRSTHSCQLTHDCLLWFQLYPPLIRMFRLVLIWYLKGYWINWPRQAIADVVSRFRFNNNYTLRSMNKSKTYFIAIIKEISLTVIVIFICAVTSGFLWFWS